MRSLAQTSDLPAFLLVLGLVLMGAAYIFIRLSRQAKARREASQSQAGPPPPRRAAGAPPPKPAPAEKPTPKPTPSSPSKTAEQIFREAFPDLHVEPAPLPQVPFAVRLVAEKEEVRVDVQGSVAVGTAATLDFVITLTDVTADTPEQVFATTAQYQDEQTGVYVVRSSLGPVKAPGYRDRGWTALGVVRLAALQTPFSGRRTLRVTCVGLPATASSQPLASQAFRSATLCSATDVITLDIARRGYVEQRRVRERVPGSIVCLGWAFAATAELDRTRTESALRGWMRAQAQQVGEDTKTRRAIAEGMEAALALAQHGLALEPAASAIAQLGVPEASRQALELCLELAVAVAGSSAACYPVLREAALGMGLDAAEFTRMLQASADPQLQAWTAMEKQVGLDPKWPTERIRKYLSDQFHKWNARSASVRDLSEREEIAARLWALAKLRQRHR